MSLVVNKAMSTLGKSESMSTKYIFVTGGVVSSIGKGLVASLGRLLKKSRS